MAPRNKGGKNATAGLDFHLRVYSVGVKRKNKNTIANKDDAAHEKAHMQTHREKKNAMNTDYHGIHA